MDRINLGQHANTDIGSGLYVSVPGANVMHPEHARLGNMMFDSSQGHSAFNVIQSGTFKITCSRKPISTRPDETIGTRPRDALEGQLLNYIEGVGHHGIDIPAVAHSFPYDTGRPANMSPGIGWTYPAYPPGGGDYSSHSNRSLGPKIMDTQEWNRPTKGKQSNYLDTGSQAISITSPLPNGEIPKVSLNFAVGNSSGHFHPWYADTKILPGRDGGDWDDIDHAASDFTKIVHMDSNWMRLKWGGLGAEEYMGVQHGYFSGTSGEHSRETSMDNFYSDPGVITEDIYPGIPEETDEDRRSNWAVDGVLHDSQRLSTAINNSQGIVGLVPYVNATSITVDAYMSPTHAGLRQPVDRTFETNRGRQKAVGFNAIDDLSHINFPMETHPHTSDLSDYEISHHLNSKKFKHLPGIPPPPLMNPGTPYSALMDGTSLNVVANGIYRDGADFDREDHGKRDMYGWGGHPTEFFVNPFSNANLTFYTHMQPPYVTNKGTKEVSGNTFTGHYIPIGYEGEPSDGVNQVWGPDMVGPDVVTDAQTPTTGLLGVRFGSDVRLHPTYPYATWIPDMWVLPPLIFHAGLSSVMTGVSQSLLFHMFDTVTPGGVLADSPFGNLDRYFSTLGPGPGHIQARSTTDPDQYEIIKYTSHTEQRTATQWFGVNHIFVYDDWPEAEGGSRGAKYPAGDVNEFTNIRTVSSGADFTTEEWSVPPQTLKNGIIPGQLVTRISSDDSSITSSVYLATSTTIPNTGASPGDVAVNDSTDLSATLYWDLFQLTNGDIFNDGDAVTAKNNDHMGYYLQNGIPPSGLIQIDDEIIKYTSTEFVSPPGLGGLAGNWQIFHWDSIADRAQNGTTIANHYATIYDPTGPYNPDGAIPNGTAGSNWPSYTMGSPVYLPPDIDERGIVTRTASEHQWNKGTAHTPSRTVFSGAGVKWPPGDPHADYLDHRDWTGSMGLAGAGSKEAMAVDDVYDTFYCSYVVYSTGSAPPRIDAVVPIQVTIDVRSENEGGDMINPLKYRTDAINEDQRYFNLNFPDDFVGAIGTASDPFAAHRDPVTNKIYGNINILFKIPQYNNDIVDDYVKIGSDDFLYGTDGNGYLEGKPAPAITFDLSDSKFMFENNENLTLTIENTGYVLGGGGAGGAGGRAHYFDLFGEADDEIALIAGGGGSAGVGSGYTAQADITDGKYHLGVGIGGRGWGQGSSLYTAADFTGVVAAAKGQDGRNIKNFAIPGSDYTGPGQLGGGAGSTIAHTGAISLILLAGSDGGDGGDVFNIKYGTILPSIDIINKTGLDGIDSKRPYIAAGGGGGGGGWGGINNSQADGSADGASGARVGKRANDSAGIPGKSYRSASPSNLDPGTGLPYSINRYEGGREGYIVSGYLGGAYPGKVKIINQNSKPVVGRNPSGPAPAEYSSGFSVVNETKEYK